MLSKKYKIGEMIVEITSAVEIKDSEPYSSFLCSQGEPNCFVTIAVKKEITPPRGKMILEDDESVTVETDGECAAYYKRRAEGGYFAKRVSDGKNIYVCVAEDVSNRLWARVVFGIIGFEQLAALNFAAVLHASLICVNSQAILFTAPCGTGKSTQAALWEKYEGAQIINGDKALVYFCGETPVASGLPFAGSSKICKNAACPIKAIVRLGQADENEIEKITGAQAFLTLIKGCYLPKFPENLRQTAARTVERLAQCVPVYELNCLPDKSAVETLKNAFGVNYENC